MLHCFAGERPRRELVLMRCDRGAAHPLLDKLLDLGRGDGLRGVAAKHMQVGLPGPLVIDIDSTDVKGSHQLELTLQVRKALGCGRVLRLQGADAHMVGSGACVHISKAALGGRVILRERIPDVRDQVRLHCAEALGETGLELCSELRNQRRASCPNGGRRRIAPQLGRGGGRGRRSGLIAICAAAAAALCIGSRLGAPLAQRSHGAVVAQRRRCRRS